MIKALTEQQLKCNERSQKWYGKRTGGYETQAKLEKIFRNDYIRRHAKVEKSTMESIAKKEKMERKIKDAKYLRESNRYKR